jgi:hypothetical protein
VSIWLITPITRCRFERQLYRNVVLHDQDKASLFLQCIRLRDDYQDFVMTSIKSISLSGDINGTTIVEILSLCTGINTLAILCDSEEFQMYDKEPILQALDALPLNVLSLQMDLRLIRYYIPSVTVVMSRLTHLEIDDNRMLSSVDMKFLPRLTHLALVGTTYDPSDNLPSLVKRLLSHPTLQILIFCTNQHSEFSNFLDIHKLHDPRMILAPRRQYSWDDLGRASMLFWEIAEDVAKLREPNHSKSILSCS